jgi:rSAM/selenodomain-associated transferase 2
MLHGGVRVLPRVRRMSVIVPTLDEASVIAVTLTAARAAANVELIVVDGGSSDDTVRIARDLADEVLSTARGRALQMNAGARMARGDVFLFLHADTRLPVGYAAAIGAALEDAGAVGGRFDLRLDAPGVAYRLLERAITTRSRLTRVATGDQAIFVRRAVFERLGGFPLLPLMEDVALARALKRTGRVACLRDAVLTSARRWQRHGLARTVVLMWTLKLAYYVGVSPERLARAYAHAR